MSAFPASQGEPPGHDPREQDLEDAREALAYWEERARRLPRSAVRGRREAREMAARWGARVGEAEREVYGRGLLGALMLLLAERRLPQPARRTGRVAVRRASQVTVALVVALLAVAAIATVALVELLAAVF